MDRNGIAFIVTGITYPGVYFGDQSAANDLARPCNEYVAQVVRDHPKRIGGLITLPLPDVDASLREIAYGFDVLKLDGVGFLSSYQGAYLGDPAFEAVFGELDRRNAVAHIHPSIAPKNVDSPVGLPGWCLEFPFDTTRVIANLAVTATLKRHPHIKFIVSHSGGVPCLTLKEGLREQFLPPTKNMAMRRLRPGLEGYITTRLLPPLRRTDVC